MITANTHYNHVTLSLILEISFLVDASMWITWLMKGNRLINYGKSPDPFENRVPADWIPGYRVF